MSVIDLTLTTDGNPMSVADAADGFADANALDPKSAMTLNLILEELVTNVFKYGSAGGSARVRVHVAREGTVLLGSVRDTGVPFDPLAQAPVDVTADLEDRAIGGLGIHLVRSLASRLAYAREGGENVLHFEIALAAD